MSDDRGVDDRKVREQIKKKDYEHIARMKKEMEIEDQELRQYFRDAKRPTTADPTLKRKQAAEEKMKTVNEAARNFFQSLNLLKSFWRYEPNTPEEKETFRLCKRHVKRNVIMSSLGGLAITSFTSYYYRVYFGWPMIAFGVFTGIMGGTMFGLLCSTKYVLQQLDSLGTDFNMGRVVHQEIEDYRLDREKRPN